MKITWLKYEKNRKIDARLAIIFVMSIGLILARSGYSLALAEDVVIVFAVILAAVALRTSFTGKQT